MTEDKPGLRETYHKSYKEGVTGHPRQEVEGGRLKKIINHFGHSAGRRSTERVRRENERHEKRNAKLQEQVRKKSNPLNQKALDIVTLGNTLSDEDRPRSGWTDTETKKHFANWFTSLRSPGPEADIDKGNLSTMLSEPLGRFRLEGEGLIGGSFHSITEEFPVHNIHILCESPILDEPFNPLLDTPQKLGPAQTRIDINSVPYDPEMMAGAKEIIPGFHLKIDRNTGKIIDCEIRTSNFPFTQKVSNPEKFGITEETVGKLLNNALFATTQTAKDLEIAENELDL